MTKFVEYGFHIKKRTPETLPMKELSKYLGVLAQCFGREAHVHFKEVRDGSACAIIQVDEAVNSDVLKNIYSSESRKKINGVLADNDTCGYLKSESLKENIIFEGLKQEEAYIIGPIVDGYTVNGKIISISGKDNTVNVDILESDGELYHCRIDDERAKDLRWGQYVSAKVKGEWVRTNEGKWAVPPRRKLDILTYRECENLSVVEELSKLAGILSDESFNRIQRNIALDKEDELLA